ncbi:sodium-dependent transporter [Clostridia bacterium]|nr:sodium-dependent transporter [Clostridia bacterium]
MQNGTTAKRDSFNSRIGFILACVGSAVGMGNIWMFPQRFARGGGVFLILYIVFALLIAGTGVICEMTFGRGTRAGPVGAFRAAVASRGGSGKLGGILGTVPVAGSLAMAIGYSVVVGWILKYTFAALSNTLTTIPDENLGAFFGETARGFGNNICLWLGIGTALFILIAGVGGGIEKINKVMMPLFFALFLFLGIFAATLPGTGAGYAQLFHINPADFANPVIWISALGQAFFSLSIAGNGTLIYGSYLSKKENIPSSAINVAVFDTIAGVLAALVIVPALAAFGANPADSANTGPGLMFVALPALFKSQMGVFGPYIAIVFFVAVMFAGITSLINMYEAPIATLQEKLKLTRVKSCIIIGGFALTVSTLIQGIVGEWMDYVSVFVCPLGAGMAGIMLYWVFGKKWTEKQIQTGMRKPLPKFLYPLGKYVYCAVCVGVLAIGAVTFVTTGSSPL